MGTNETELLLVQEGLINQLNGRTSSPAYGRPCPREASAPRLRSDGYLATLMQAKHRQ